MPSSTSVPQDLSNEAYFILRSNECLSKNIYQSKAWILTAKTLYPRHFQTLFEAYLIEKLAKDPEKAAKCFSILFQSFISESNMWEELNNIIIAILSENPTSEELFLREMFSLIPLSVQHDILSVTSERSENPLEYCKLVLIMLSKFPYTVPKLAARLVETLLSAEKHTFCESAVNPYREILVHDVFSVLLEREQFDLPTKLLIRMLYKMIDFYICYYMDKSCIKKENSEEKRYLEPKVDGKCKEWLTGKYNFSWEKMFHLLTMFGNRLQWELCSMFVYPWDREITWQHLINFSTTKMNEPDTGKNVKQFVLCLTISFSYCLCQYYSHLHQKIKAKSPVILLEAFTSIDDIEGSSDPPLKKSRSLIVESKPALSVGCENKDVLKHFMFAAKCWDMLHSSDTIKKEFGKLKHHLRLDPWLPEFIFDLGLYHGQISEIPTEILTDPLNVRNMLKGLSYHYFMQYSPQLLIEQAVNLIKRIETLPELGCCFGSLTKQAARHLCFIPIEKIPALQYIVKMLIILLKQSLRSKYVDTNHVYALLLTLSQLNWPSEQQLAREILLRIKKFGSFSFRLFTNCIINIEILEEFMRIILDETNTVKLDILPVPLSTMLTGDNANEIRLSLKKMIRSQVKRCNEPLHTIIIDYLLQEENYLIHLFMNC